MASGEVQSKSGFAGVYPMLYAFFDREDRLDRHAMERQVAGCLAAGAHGLAILGIASEMTKLSFAERIAFLDITAAANGGRVPLAVTVPEASVPAQTDFARRAEAAGADWLILQPPPVKGAGEGELIRFFGRVADACTVPVAIQNNPVNMDVWLSDEGLRSLVRQHGNVRLLKGEGPLLSVRRTVEALDDAVDVFGGLAGKEAPGLYRAGCVGLIPAPDVVDVHARIFEAFTAGDEDEAERLYGAILPLVTFVNASVAHYLCYGKRLVARRFGLGEVVDRVPAMPPHPFGEAMVERYGRALPGIGV